jgi:phage terminase large subunit GpA-like protein
MAALALLAEAFAQGFAPLPDVTVSQWADKYRIVSKPSPFPGEWRTDRVPYMREIMDRMSPSDPTQFVVNMKAAQGGGTEGALNSVACYMHLYPRDIMILLPTIKMAQKFSHKRLDRMIAATPVLRDLISAPRSREASNTSVLKEYGPGRDNLILTGANSWADLQSDPIPFLSADEVDSFKLDLPGLGNPLYSAIQRTARYHDRKVLLTGTPTITNGNINTWFKSGDQNEYFLPCPYCTHMQVFVWGADRLKRKQPGGIRWPKGQPQQAKYECEKCERLFEEWQKIEVLGAGQWRPHAPGNGAEEFIRSYHMGVLIYPYGGPGSKWGNLAAEWEKNHDKLDGRRMFLNLKEGLPWSDPSEAVADAKTLLARCTSNFLPLPAGIVCLTLAADIQGDRIEVEVLGWGAGEENWSIDYKVLRGDTAKPDSQVWSELDDLIAATYLSETGITLGIRAACIDASYQQDLVRKFCHARRQRNVWAVIGRDGQDRPAWPTRASKVKAGRPAPAFVIGVDGLKETVYARLRILEGPGCCHFPRGRTLNQFEMLTAEVRVPDYSHPIPIFRWQKKREGIRNEWLDIRAYQHACLRGLEFQTSFRLDREVEKFRALVAALHAAPAAPVAPPAAPKDWLGDRGKDWF